MNALSTPEKFILLAHHPAKGRYVISQLHLKYGLAGALLLELTLDGSAEMREDRLVLRRKPETRNALLNEITGMLSDSSRPRKIRYWIRQLARRQRRYQRDILNDLHRRRIVRIVQRRFLGWIPYRRSYLIGNKIHQDLIREIRKNILQKEDPSNEWVAAMGLIEACKMHRILSQDRSERKMIRKKLKLILKESPIASDVDKAIRQVQAAIVASVAASSAAAAAAGSH
jgi:hypothetical protein